MTTSVKTRPKIGIDPAKAVETIRKGPVPVQGVNADLSDVVLHSEAKKGMVLAVELGGAIIGAELERTIEGASTVSLQVYDPEGKILTAAVLRSRFNCRIAGLWFNLVSVSKQGFNVSLVFEDREVSWLRELKGPKKAYRDLITRAEFFLMLLGDVKKGKIEFYCPELHKTQPIKQSKELTQSSNNPEDTVKQSNRGQGVSADEAKDLSIKGTDIKPQQLANLNTVLDVGMSLNMPYKVLWAAVAAGTVESLFKNFDSSEALDGSDSHGIFAMRPSAGFTTSTDVAVQARQFFKGTDNGIQGCYEIYKKNPDLSVGELAAEFENPAAQYRGRYAEWAAEAKRSLDAYLGGESVGEGEGNVEASQRYAFQVGKKQDYWDWMGSAAEEVRWRRFMVAGKLYYCSEETLFQSQVRMVVTPTTRGIENVDFDITMGKKWIEATITCWGKDWTAPPGTVVRVKGYGPLDGGKEDAAGRYLVVSISNNLFTDYVSITIRRPIRPIPEPAAETSVRSSGFAPEVGANGPQGASPDVAKSLEAMVSEIHRLNKKYPYSSPGSRGTPPPGSGPYDCSGFVSRILYVGGLLGTSLSTVTLAEWGKSGGGNYLTLFIRPPAGPAGHVIGRIWTPDGMRYFGTSSENGGGGWISDGTAQYELANLPVKRHAANY